MAKAIVPLHQTTDEEIINHFIHGLKVMLDKGWAEMYDVDVKRLNEAVKRNNTRFPGDFMFQLSLQEWQNLKSQIATSSWGGSRKLPYAFTEQGGSDAIISSPFGTGHPGKYPDHQGVYQNAPTVD